MREDQGAGLVPVPVRCQLRERTAVRNPKSGEFDLPLVCEITATLGGETGQYLTLTLSAATTEKLSPAKRYALDAVALWSDREEELLPMEPVEVVNKPTKMLDSPIFPDEAGPAVPDFVQAFTDALTD